MLLNSLYLRNFRSHKDALFTFSPFFNLICGPNAVGKTTLLEAIYYLMIGRSFRTPYFQDLIAQEASSFYLETHFLKCSIPQTLKVGVSTEEKKITYNSTPLTTSTGLYGLIPGVLNFPDDIYLIKGSPALRRNFLDVQLSQIDPFYTHHLLRYKKALQQRNQLLKSSSLRSIETWEEIMALSAAYLTLERKKTLGNLSALSQTVYLALTGKEEIMALNYMSDIKEANTLEHIKDQYRLELQKNRNKEKTIGYTLTGPHKDDFLITLCHQEARYFGSEGEQRSCAIALKLAEWRQIKDRGEEEPLLLLDDAFLSLDESRKNRLMNYLTTLGQTFITTTDTRFFNTYSAQWNQIDLSQVVTSLL